MSHMEDEMNLPEYTRDSSINVDDVIKLVDTLYNSKNQADQAKANQSLIDLQSSDNAWHICWPLLDPSKSTSVEVHFFAANTLVLKINQSWNQQDEEWLEKHLRPKLFETLVNYASSPNGGKLVVERLSLALATFALHSIPTFWPDAIENILETFTQQHLSASISPQRICDILLKILIYIPEEFAVLTPHSEHRAKLNGQITKSGPVVFKFLHSLLIADQSAVTIDCKQNVLKCLTSWTLHSRTSLLELPDGQVLLQLLYDLIMDEELCSLACATLAATFRDQRAENYRNSVIAFIPKIAGLKQVLDKYIGDDNIECVIKIYSLIVNFSENHSKLFLKLVLNDIQIPRGQSEVIKQAIFTIIRMVLDCTSAPGIYGMDEKYSDIAFPFWFAFFENFYYYSESSNDLICETFDPLVDSLLQTLVRKAQYPSSTVYYQVWNDDQRESYRCYRQDLGDNISVVVHFPRSRGRILARLLSQLEQELNVLKQINPQGGEKTWQGFESTMFAIKSIAESVPFDEEKYVPKIFDLLAQVPFNESPALLYCTVADMISAYSDWLYSHRDHLATAFNVLFLGIDSSNADVRLMSTLSLKDLTTECQTVLGPFACQIVNSCTNAILQPNSNLNTNEKSRLMYTIGTSLVMAPLDSVESMLKAVTMPLICELGAKVQLDPLVEPTCRSILSDRLTMLNSLIESLYMKQYIGNDYECEGDGDENNPKLFDPTRFDASTPEVNTTQPAISLLMELIPILTLVSSKYGADEEIMEILTDTIKRSAKSLGIEVKPALKDLLLIIFNAYDPLTNSNILEGLTPLHMLFKVDATVQPYLLDTFVRISDKTLEVCLKNPLRQLSLTIEHYFRYATLVCKKFDNFLTTQASGINVEYIYKLAIACLELPEKRTLAEVCNFLSQLRQKSIGSENLHRIFVSHLDVMLSNIFNIFGGTYSTPRNAIEHVTDLLFVLTDVDEAKAPLKMIVNKENFPTSFVNREQKARFVTSIVHEKNRKKFKDSCAEFVMIVRNLNRLV